MNIRVDLSVIGFVLIILKIVGVVTFSWWWVLLPFWGPFVMVILIGFSPLLLPLALVCGLLYCMWQILTSIINLF